MNSVTDTIYGWFSNLYSSGVRDHTARKIPISQCNVSWLGDNRYFTVQYDKNLGRDIVYLKTVYCLDIKHTFRNVKPGKYMVIIRMDIEHGGWPSCGNNKTRLFARWNDGDKQIVFYSEFDAADFKQIRRDLKTLEYEDAMQFDGSSVRNYDSVNHWFDLCLDEFELGTVSDVTCGLADNYGSWKTGMRWDYIELVNNDR